MLFSVHDIIIILLINHISSACTFLSRLLVKPNFHVHKEACTAHRPTYQSPRSNLYCLMSWFLTRYHQIVALFEMCTPGFIVASNVSIVTRSFLHFLDSTISLVCTLSLSLSQFLLYTLITSFFLQYAHPLTHTFTCNYDSASVYSKVCRILHEVFCSRDTIVQRYWEYMFRGQAVTGIENDRVHYKSLSPAISGAWRLRW